jgi:lipopolysaccharide/colanic/teichoic acid biosynthesis glycosyltransferase
VSTFLPKGPENIAVGQVFAPYDLDTMATPESATERGREASAVLQEMLGRAKRKRQTVVEHLGNALERAVEITVASIALVVTSPVMLLVAAIVRLDSPGPAFFMQLRVGRNGRLFRFWKFRTLYVDARARFPELYSYTYTEEEIQRLRFKHEQDPRVTRVGRWLRKSTLDELPNFWNVLKGDVALVGPRPEIPEMVPNYSSEQLIKFSVKPGITGLAQTNGRGNLAFQQTIAYDVEYVKHKSLWLDMKLIAKTITLLARLDGAF